MTVENEDDVVGLKRAGRAVREALEEMAANVAPGITTADLDAIGRDVLRRHGATSAPQKAYDFPGTTCISVEDQLAHGVPSPKRRLREGQLVNVDVSAELDGYWADTGSSFPVGRVSGRRRVLLSATKAARRDAVLAAKAGGRMSDIGRAVERRARRHGFRVVRNLGGHGVGRFIHEDPHVPMVAIPGDRTRLWEGLVITVEPFLTTGATEVFEDEDGWTLRTPDGSVGAQFEHTLIVTRGAPIVVT